MLSQVARRPASVSELAGPTGLRLPPVIQHLAVPEAAGLITTSKDGYVRSCMLVPETLELMKG